MTYTFDTRDDMLGYTRLASMENRRDTKIQVGDEEKATTTHWAVGEREGERGRERRKGRGKERDEAVRGKIGGRRRDE